LACTILLAGCARNDVPDSTSGGLGAAGGVGLALTVSDGSDVECVNYEISRAGLAVRSGTLAIAADGHVTGTIAELETGQGYRVDLEAPRKRSKEGGVAPCLGSALFGIDSDQTTALSVFLQCDDTSPQQNVNVIGDLNFCPQISCASALPNTQEVGKSVELSVTAEDKDKDELSFAWSNGGEFAANAVFATGSHVSYPCTAAGTFQVNVQVLDREVNGCTKTLAEAISVTCFEPEPPAEEQADCGVPAPSSRRK
jgi:hypothetical protein